MADKRADLQKLRLACGFTQRTLANAIEASEGSVRAWESGLRTPTARHRRTMAYVFGVSVHTINRMVGLEPPVDLDDGHPVPAWLSHYDSLVLEAGRLARLEKDVVPAILQTKAYAHAVERAAPITLNDEEILERIDIRVARQQVLERTETPLQLELLITEGVLRDVVGGLDVMGGQLDHLIDMASRPNVEIKILASNGTSVCSPGGFELLMRRFEAKPFLVVTASMAGPHYHEMPEAIRKFAGTFNHLASVAVPPTESIDLMREIRETYE